MAETHSLRERAEFALSNIQPQLFATNNAVDELDGS